MKEEYRIRLDPSPSPLTDTIFELRKLKVNSLF
jgi:hypothetical protein